MLKQFFAMFKARTMEFVRDKGSFYWSLLFPVFLVFGFAFAFSGSGTAMFKVGVIGTSDTSLAFMQTRQIQFISYGNETSADVPACGGSSFETADRHDHRLYQRLGDVQQRIR